MKATRRSFLKNVSTAGVVSIGAAAPTFLNRAAYADERESSKSNKDRILVLVQLEGGNDGLNTVIPVGDSEYKKLRPGIAINNGLDIGDDLAFHPAMSGMKGLLDDGQLSVIQGVGYPNPDRSHFRSMDIWNSARLTGELTRDGWLGRALDLRANQPSGQTPALAIGTERLPLALVGAKTNVPMIRDIDAFKLKPGAGKKADQERRQQALAELIDRPAATGSELDFLRATANNALATAKKLESLTASYKPATDYPNSPLANKLKTVAQLITAEFGTRIYFVSLGGFDTHSQQAGSHQALLSELSNAVAAFHKDLAGHKLGDQVLLATYSEFGRRAKENGSLGTDHGTASQMFVASTRWKRHRRRAPEPH